MTRVQIIEQNGSPAFAVVPFDLWLKVRKTAEDMEDLDLYDEAKRNDTGFRIPHSIVEKTVLGDEHLVKAWREHRGLTVETLATIAGISKAYLSQIENGKRHGTLKTIKAIAKALDVPLDILIEDEELKQAA